jgi:tRNA-dihydrouridine synthase
MVSSFALHYRNERTLRELLVLHPDEHPVSIQLFGHDAEVMRSGAEIAAQAGADLIDINMGCPVPKVRRTGAGAELLADPDRAVAVARAAVEGAGGAEGVPVMAKLRSGLRAGDTSGVALAHRLVGEAGVSAIAFHPRSAAVHHKGVPDYELARGLVETLPAPVILTGGLSDAAAVRDAFAQTGAAAVMLARGALGNPWLFAELCGSRDRPPDRDEVLDELDWTMDAAVEHLGAERAGRYLRKFYPWYIERLGLPRAPARELQEALQVAPTVEDARALLGSLRQAAAVA